MENFSHNSHYFQLPVERKFRVLLDEFCQRALQEGVTIVPYTDASWYRFRSLSPEQQLLKFESFEKYYQICVSGVEEGVQLRDGRELLRKMIAKLGLHCCDEVFDKLSNEDVIEVYTKEFIQVFRNLKFLEICSYPLIDLYTYEWHELYRRPHIITQKLIEGAYEILNFKEPKTIVPNVPEHFLEEVFSPRRHKFFIRQKMGSPLWDSTGSNTAFIGVLEATLLDFTDEKGVSKFNVIPLSM